MSNFQKGSYHSVTDDHSSVTESSSFHSPSSNPLSPIAPVIPDDIPSQPTSSDLTLSPPAVSLLSVSSEPNDALIEEMKAMSLVWKEEKRNKLSVIVLGLAFFFTFSMYSPTQNVMTTLFSSVGIYSLSLVYSFFALSTIFSPALTRLIGAKNGIIIAAIGYCAYTASMITNSTGVILFFSAILGFAAGLLWTSQGVVLTSLSTKENRGRNSALFVGLFRFSAFFSNVLMGILLNTDTNVNVLFGVFLAIGSIGVMLLIYLRVRITENERLKAMTLANAHAPLPPPTAPTVHMSIMNRFLEIFRGMIAHHYRHFTPVLFVCTGMNNGWFFGTFGRVMGKKLLGYGNGVSGLVMVCVIFTSGKVLDKLSDPRYKKRMVFGLTCVSFTAILLAQITTLFSAGFSTFEIDKEQKVSFSSYCLMVFGTCIIWAVGSSGTDICMYYFLQQLFPDKAETVFAGKSFLEAMGFVTSLLLSNAISFQYYPLFLMCLFIPCVSWFLLWKIPFDLLQKAPSKSASSASSSSVSTSLKEVDPTGSNQNSAPETTAVGKV